jgi:F-type H+-transporting ATPase subunit epsilon
MNMPKTCKLSIYTPEKMFFEGEVTQVIVTTPEGVIGVMPGYMPSINLVSESILKVEQEGAWHQAAVSQGFMEISVSGAELYVDTAEWAQEIDVLRSEAALRRAEERLRGKLSHTEYLHTHAAIARAKARLDATRRG